jgi:hypothetical protein
MVVAIALPFALLFAVGCPADGGSSAVPDGGAGTQAGAGAGAGGSGEALVGEEGEDPDAGSPTCERPNGAYEALYVAASGDCGPIAQPFPIPIETGDASVATTTEMRLNVDITTMVVLRGCSVRITQTVTAKTGAVESQISANALSIDPDGVLRGTADLVRFSENNQPLCQGSYQVTLMRRRALGAP